MGDASSSKHNCLICGRPTAPRLICAVCARRLRKDALREEIEDEEHGKRRERMPRP